MNLTSTFLICMQKMEHFQLIGPDLIAHHRFANRQLINEPLMVNFRKLMAASVNLALSLNYRLYTRKDNVADFMLHSPASMVAAGDCCRLQIDSLVKKICCFVVSQVLNMYDDLEEI